VWTTIWVGESDEAELPAKADEVRRIVEAIPGNDVRSVCRAVSDAMPRKRALHLLNELTGFAFSVIPRRRPTPADESPSLIVIDDFWDDPDALRAQALAAAYRPFPDFFLYPGKVSVDAGPNADAVMVQIEKLLGRRIVWGAGEVHGHFRITHAGQEKRGVNVHHDPFGWNAVLYLSKPEHCRGGISFYRHKQTGFMGIDAGTHARFVGSDEAFLAEVDRVIEADGATLDGWEELARVDIRYNRMIILNCRFFHNINAWFGDRDDNARITQSFSCYAFDDPRRFEFFA
jgi:hypothetical protein